LKFFPDVNPTSECTHGVSTCQACVKKWVKAQIEGGQFTVIKGEEDGFGIVCPECPAVMKEINIQEVATKKVLQR
jgi:ariadne-1